MSTTRIDSKLPDVGTTIFAVMSQKAQQHGALNLSQGFPDFESPEGLRARVEEAMATGHNQYAPMPGLPLLRQRIAEKVEAMYGASVDAEAEITVTSGATEALFVAIQTVVRPGDEVIVFDPAYDSYEPAVRLAGGRCIHLPLVAPDYRIDFDRLTAALGARTRLVIVNSPHNPTGAVLSRADLDRLAEVLRASGCWLLSDEVYEHIVFDGRSHASVLGHPELRARSFAVSSFGKTYHTTGWKIGYCIAPSALTSEFRKVHQFVTFSVSTPMQLAIAEFMSDPTFHLELPAFYQARRDRFRSALADSAWTLLPCPGTYFQLLGYGGISDRPDTEMADWLVEHAGVAAIPVSVFHADRRDDRVLRFCFAKTDATLDRAAERLTGITAVA
ncbi:pyridoxal phosphate-dependent aminotransferase [Wenzhouxiangella sp. XN79A]|uniref:pyridoxal phosphate-dependent aminotransferase n=1 Tax=Wenzhouxiangella sp. XN79A TaxID=2724193 RepID=UPI00144AC1DF|nr:pyridoxal phosphate-dependent aminotransferase [Wenzhouxiangella sp. XN79A]NKI34531.1 pyridoxal phosphate-dependent aminotransferase [Wenzhouxiangella sp. XN79A]